MADEPTSYPIIITVEEKLSGGFEHFLRREEIPYTTRHDIVDFTTEYAFKNWGDYKRAAAWAAGADFMQRLMR